MSHHSPPACAQIASTDDHTHPLCPLRPAKKTTAKSLGAIVRKTTAPKVALSMRPCGIAGKRLQISRDTEVSYAPAVQLRWVTGDKMLAQCVAKEWCAVVLTHGDVLPEEVRSQHLHAPAARWPTVPWCLRARALLRPHNPQI